MVFYLIRKYLKVNTVDFIITKMINGVLRRIINENDNIRHRSDFIYFLT